MRCESNIKSGSAGLRPSPTAHFRSLRGLGLRRTIPGISGRSTPATPSLSFGGGLRSAGPSAPGSVTAGRLDSPCRVLPSGHTLAPEVNRPAWIYWGPGCIIWPDRVPSCLLPLPWERRSLVRRTRREGDTCLSPGVTRGRGGGYLVAHQRNRTRPQRPERSEGSESQSVRDGISSDEQSVETVCEERGSAAGGEEETTKPAGVRGPGL